MRALLAVALIVLAGCNTADVTCIDDTPAATFSPTPADCPCNCPDGIPERLAGEDGDFCADAADGETCCFWQTDNALMFGTCTAHICMVPIKQP